MDQQLEDQGIANLIDKLVERFPSIAGGQIAQVVRECHDNLRGNPIRKYVPVLVEHSARDRLRQLVANQQGANLQVVNNAARLQTA